MNCTIRKTKNASVAKYFGSIRGVYVLIMSMLRNSTYWGISSTWYGSRRVPIINVKSRLRPANLIFEKAYAVSEQDTRIPITEPTARKSELKKNVEIGMSAMPSARLV